MKIGGAFGKAREEQLRPWWDPATLSRFFALASIQETMTWTIFSMNGTSVQAESVIMAEALRLNSRKKLNSSSVFHKNNPF